MHSAFIKSCHIFEFINISASDLGLTPSVSSLALDKHIPLWSGFGVEDMDELGSD